MLKGFSFHYSSNAIINVLAGTKEKLDKNLISDEVNAENLWRD